MPATRHPTSASFTLAANLRTFRTRAGLSQEELADRAGVHRTYVSQVERQVVNPTLASVSKLADALGLPLARLLDGTTAPDSAPHRLRSGPRGWIA
ncbi:MULTISPECIES: helix-turn-helix transcriptional regulator [unclassified Variovorax]|uniref:helix-turn-helix domain-containing protein n=1 Tax=unclassified Variovorax TaxID=663243 RepID=UPI0008390E8F|nr:MULTISPECIES: helix-turn-helix transcriptional regulator [unclassified Variovorax]PNG50122.1 HTH-type transcriptional regulator SinR [Variovorax sp. B2]PNG50995.1 HTH-type transcriptional regulator SinR [Variovorax sp. B4]VTV17159.1 HTH-type transcriptional regulator SinR [Variovorax sp. WDL1]